MPDKFVNKIHSSINYKDNPLIQFRNKYWDHEMSAVEVENWDEHLINEVTSNNYDPKIILEYLFDELYWNQCDVEHYRLLNYIRKQL